MELPVTWLEVGTILITVTEVVLELSMEHVPSTHSILLLLGFKEYVWC